MIDSYAVTKVTDEAEKGRDEIFNAKKSGGSRKKHSPGNSSLLVFLQCIKKYAWDQT